MVTTHKTKSTNQTPLQVTMRAALLRRSRGTWKGSLKKSLRTLASVRKGWERKLP